MARWSKEKQAQARATIIERAKELFESDGFEATTMRSIARASGLAVGTLFNYFEDKSALIFAAFHEDLGEVVERCIAGLPAPGTLGFVDLCEQVATEFYTYYAARPALSRVMLRESLLATSEPGQAFQAQVEQVAHAMAAHVIALQQRGALDPAAQPQHLILAFMSHYYFVLLMEIRNDVPDTSRQSAMVRALATQLLRGVGAPSDRGGEDGS